MRLIRAALTHSVALVDLAEPHVESGRHILQIRLHGKPLVVLSAERAGETANGSFALRLAPLDPTHVPELAAISEATDDSEPTSGGPMSATATSLGVGPRAFSKTLPDPEPSMAFDDELEASVLFDPEAALISRAPARPGGTGAEDTLTIPVRASMVPPGAMDPPRRSAPPRAQPDAEIGVVFEDASLTPTVPMDVPPRRPPSIRREPSVRTQPVDMDQTVSEDGETMPLSSSRKAPAQSTAAQSSGPRTMRRTTGSHGIVVVGRVIANRYRIESLVGAGAVGAVYKASHVDLPRTVAIKVLHPHFRADPQLLASFRTEARAASLLDHPNVTVVHDFGEEPDGLVYIVMEFLAGRNLQAVLDEQRRIEPQRALAIMLQVCGALSAAHERGIVHRDVKPDNIMLVPTRDDEGRTFEMVKVCDFGIAALESAPQDDPSAREWTAGTPEYMAPEQSHGRSDQRTDVYACGIVLYEMLAGRPPFVGESPAAILAKHATEMPRRPSELVPGFPPRLEAVILCAIEKSPERRFATIRDLRSELKRLL
ncbi:MAG: Serine/threonine protein kinase PrkC, regulator of stationary phase [Labilithrix sp.]|nr:Serine/threonine protein kinase PrkC, regulator of stationary phase [Labilithrix sp.]